MDYIFILLTIYIASRQSLLFKNISSVSASPKYHLIVLIYTCLIALYLFYQQLSFLKIVSHKKTFLLISLLCALSLSISSLIIYKDNTHLASRIHVYTSLFPIVIIFLLQISILNLLKNKMMPLCIELIKRFMVYISLITIILCTFACINGLSEIITLIYIFSFNKKVRSIL